jgi:hypothetical protein
VILPMRAPVMETTDNGEIGYSVYKGETREKPATLPGRDQAAPRATALLSHRVGHCGWTRRAGDDSPFL